MTVPDFARACTARWDSFSTAAAPARPGSMLLDLDTRAAGYHHRYPSQVKEDSARDDESDMRVHEVAQIS